MEKKKTRQNTLLENNAVSFPYWITLACCLMFIFVAPFHTALFNGYVPQFSGPIYGALMFVSAGFLLSMLYIYKFVDLDFNTVFIFLVWLIPAVYYISSFHAASSQLAKEMNLIAVSYSIFFTLAIYLGNTIRGRVALQYGLIVSGYAIVIYGFLNMFGNTYFLQAIMRESNDAIRLTSVFQYANAYASFLIALLFASILALISSSRLFPKILNSLMLVPIIVSFLMTLSRGAIVVVPVILLILLPFLNLKKQIKTIAYLLISTVVAVSITGKITELTLSIFNRVSPIDSQTTSTISFFDASSLEGWLYAVISSVVATSVIIVLDVYLLPKIQGKYSVPDKLNNRFIIPLISILLIVLVSVLLLNNRTLTEQLFPRSVSERIINISLKENSMMDRTIYLKDSMKLLKEHPLIGTGGGGWATLYEKYQNHSYTSRQIHNFFNQFAVESGLLGLAVFVLLLTLTYYRYAVAYISRIRENKDISPLDSGLIFFAISIALLSHSILDFEMSYVFIAGIFFLSLGGIAAFSNRKLNLSFTTKFRFKPIILSPMIIAATISLIVASRYSLANQKYNEAKTSNNFSQIETLLQEANKLHPTNPNYTIFRSGVYMQMYQQLHDQAYLTKAEEFLNKALLEEPYNRGIIEQQYNIHLLKNDLKAALGTMQHAKTLFTWDQSIYERIITLAYDTKDNQLLLNTLNEMKQKEKLLNEQIKNGGPWPNKEFKISRQIYFYAGITQFNQKQYAEAADNLQYSFGEDKLATEPKERTALRYYLAALQLTNRQDQLLYDYLIKLDSNEKVELQKLVSP